MRICRVCHKEISDIFEGRICITATEFYWVHELCDPTPLKECAVVTNANPGALKR